MRGGGTCQSCLTCANGVAHGRKSFPEKFLLWPPAGAAGLRVVRPKIGAPHGVTWGSFSQTFGARARTFHGRVSCELGKVPARTVFPQMPSQTTESKLCTPRPTRLCARGSGEDIMSLTAPWSWKRRAFSAIIYCSAQDYETLSTTNDHGDHCDK